MNLYEFLDVEEGALITGLVSRKNKDKISLFSPLFVYKELDPEDKKIYNTFITFYEFENFEDDVINITSRNTKEEKINIIGDEMNLQKNRVVLRDWVKFVRESEATKEKKPTGKLLKADEQERFLYLGTVFAAHAENEHISTKDIIHLYFKVLHGTRSGYLSCYLHGEDLDLEMR